MKKFKFSIIIPVCNVNDSLDETINTIINQSISFNSIQLILVGDDNTSYSNDVCLKYLNMYPDNIVYMKKKNINESNAKNLGLKCATGELVNFTNYNTVWNKNVFKKVYNCYLKNSNHFIFSCDDNLCKFLYDKVVDVTYDYMYSKINLNSTFIKCDYAKKYNFSCDINYYDNVRYVLDMLLDNPKIMLLRKPKYKNVSNCSLFEKIFECEFNWYLSVLNNSFEYLYKKSNKKYGCIKEFIQYCFIIDLRERLVLNENILNYKYRKHYVENLSNLIMQTSEKMILNSDVFTADEKIFILEIKYGKNQISKLKYSNNKIIYKDYNFKIHDFNLLYIDQIYIKKDKIVFFGALNKKYINKNVKFYVKLNNKPIDVKYYALSKNLNLLAYNSDNIYDYVGINFDIPFNEKFWELAFYFNNTFITPKFTTGAIFTNYFDRSYHHINKRTLVHKYGKIYNQKRNIFKSFYYELSNINQMILSKKWKSILIRLYVKISRVFKRKELWFISDRVNKADDNGEYFFKYLKKNFPDKKIYFVLSSSSSDYRRMKKVGNVIDPSSLKYKFIINNADYIVSSHAENYIFNPLGKMGNYIRDQYNFKYIFLQHGVTKDDLSPWLNVNSKRIDLFVTSSILEYESMFKYNYYYDKDVVKLTGLPRFDTLIDKQAKIKEQNLIMLSFTWRNSLTIGVDHKTGNKLYNPEFKNSDYFKTINRILNDKKLLKILKEKNYKIRFIPHPNVMPQIDDFVLNDYVEVEKNEINYQEEFCKCKLLITDFSSVYFDFGYLKKPVIYFQNDRETFYKGQVYQKGYFDYDTMGFGPCFEEYDEFINALIKIINNECKIDKKYLDRINTTFKYHDKKNCERLYNEIKNLYK